MEDIRAELEALKKSNILWGKSLIACGDSFTEGDFNGWVDENGLAGHDSPVIYDSEWQMYKTYPWWIARRNGMRLTNVAKCGGVIALTDDHLKNPDTVPAEKANPFSNLTYKNLGDDVDYILIAYGLNDMFKCRLGTIDDTDNTTFYGAFNVVYRYLIERYPLAKIGAIVTNAYLSTEYAEAIRLVSRKWGIPYLDLMCDSGISTTLNKEGICEEARTMRNKTFFVTERNSHPNHLAHEFMSSYVEDFLRRL